MTWDLSGIVALVGMAFAIVGGAAVTMVQLSDVIAAVQDVRRALDDVSTRLARMEGAHIKEWHPGDD